MSASNQRTAGSQPPSLWTGRGITASWFDPANWHGGVPHAGTRTLFKTGHADTVGLAPGGLAGSGGPQAAAGAVMVAGDAVTFKHGALTLAPPVPPRGPAVDLQITGGGSVLITAGASLAGQDEVLVGDGTTGGALVVRGTLSDAQGGIFGPAGSRVLVAGDAAHWTNTSTLSIAGGSSQSTRSELIVSRGGTVDGGPDALTTGFATIAIGTGFGSGLAIVDGAGSLLSATRIDVGTGYSGLLQIRNGAQVVDRYGSAGGNGDGRVEVSGAGSAWRNLGGLQVGMQVPVASSISITNHGTVSFGAGGMALDGKLAMDATAHLDGASILSAGGSIQALDTSPTAGGTVRIASALRLTGNPLAPFQYETTYLGSEAHAVLDLAGAISSFDPNAILQVGIGHVVLSNGANRLPSIHMYGGVLEIGATGATGTAAMAFLNGASPTLRVDAGVSVGNQIAGFGARDSFDLAGIAYAPDLVPGWTPHAGGGTLGVSDGVHAQALNLLGSYSAASFHAADDGAGGTLVTFVPGHA